ncbi:MAG: DpnII family type II restriction endonuclease [candidate division WOR-3 bacterium]
MVRFKELGFPTFEEYKKTFFETLLKTNKTYEYFVDWNKVRRNLEIYLNEIQLLNSLTKVRSEERENHLAKLLKEYPKTVEVIPLIIAERVKNKKIDIFDPEIENYITLEFEKSRVNERTIPEIVEFCKKAGILELFQNIKDLYDYLLGVEVGMDTNARKNRSGEIFQKMCGEKFKRLLGKGYKIVEEDRKFSLFEDEDKNKKHDFVIYRGENPILVIECNFYNVAGSKPISIAESYIEMNRKAKNIGISFLWITDGPGWENMQNSLLMSMKEMDWILNFRMLELITKIL